jgi:hypothetical protein
MQFAQAFSVHGVSTRCLHVSTHVVHQVEQGQGMIQCGECRPAVTLAMCHNLCLIMRHAGWHVGAINLIIACLHLHQ